MLYIQFGESCAFFRGSEKNRRWILLCREHGRNLIRLSGLRPDEDIKIEFTGIRPGEKLYEELSSIEEDTVPTPHEKIRIFTANGLPKAGIEPYLESLRQICASRDVAALVFTLKELIPDYNPSAQLLHRIVDLPRKPSRAYTEPKIPRILVAS